MARTEFDYEGIKMNSIECMFFCFWLDKQDFSMNTLEKHERLKIINDWLEKYRNEQRN